MRSRPIPPIRTSRRRSRAARRWRSSPPRSTRRSSRSSRRSRPARGGAGHRPRRGCAGPPRSLTAIGQFGRVIRHHGDYHLGQALWTQDEDWLILDFEGEPARSLPERRSKRSPLRDVAGMLRSFAYAASASSIQRGRAAGGLGGTMPHRVPGRLPLDSGAESAPFRRAAGPRLLTVFELEKAVYELRYELGNRPDWVSIPVSSILRMLEAEQ